MQEIPNAQWDPRSLCFSNPPVTTNLFVIFLFSCCIWAVVVLLKTLWKTRSWPSTRRGKLISLSQALQSADATQASTLAAEIPEASPETGLRALTALKSIAFRELPADLIDRAELRFTYVLAALRATATNLKSLATLLLILTATWAAYGLANCYKGVEMFKASGIAAFYSGVVEVLGTICVSLFVLAILYVLRWRIVSLLARRERLWSLLKAQLQFLLTPPR